LAGAIQFQLDGLHPYPESEVVTSWTRLPGTSSVLITIARRDAIERYTSLFAEAGVRIACFTSSAAAIYSALRLFGGTPAPHILALEPGIDGMEVYGESSVKPLFTAHFDVAPDRAVALAAAELRMEKELAPVALAELVGSAPALPYAAGLISACPRLALPLNLLPADQRQATSPWTWAPTAALAAIVLLLTGGLAAFPAYQDHRYLAKLDAEIARVQPAAAHATALDRQVEVARKRIQLLDEMRRRPKADMDVLAEMTRLLPPPTWLNFLELNARQVTVGGETDQAAALLKTIDASPLFQSSEFNLPPVRIQNPQGGAGEGFRIRTTREGVRP
jgi:Tfp pilus assembly protein PilN